VSRRPSGDTGDHPNLKEPVIPRPHHNLARSAVIDLTLVGERGGIRRFEYRPRRGAERVPSQSPIGRAVGVLTTIVVVAHLLFWMIGLIE